MRTTQTLIMLLAICLTLSLSANASDLDNFAQCITKSGAKYYGAHWCSACAQQNEMFGSAQRHLPYIECSKQGSRERLARCEGVTGFPTWVFSDGGVRSGVLTVSLLAEYTHCPRPGGR